MKKLLILSLLIVSSISYAQKSVISTDIYLPASMNGELNVTLPFFRNISKKATIVKLTYYDNQNLLKIQFEVENQNHYIYLNESQINAMGFCDKSKKWSIKTSSKETEKWILFKIESLLNKKINIY